MATSAWSLDDLRSGDTDIVVLAADASGRHPGLLAESLLIPTGLLTAAYLARRLGPEGYGVFVVVAALVAIQRT